MVRPTKSCVGLFVLTVSLYSSMGMAAEAGPNPQASQSPFQGLGLRVTLPSTSNEPLKYAERADIIHSPHSLVSSPTCAEVSLGESAEASSGASLVVHSPNDTHLCLKADVAASMLAALEAALPGASSSSAASAAPPEVDDKEAQCREGIEALFLASDEDCQDDDRLF